jgi:hypothetical protein
VRKPPHDANQLMRDVLAHLERASFDAAPPVERRESPYAEW